jgi:hypothetical protein
VLLGEGPAFVALPNKIGPSRNLENTLDTLSRQDQSLKKPMSQSANPPVSINPDQNWLEIVSRQVQGLKFGSVQITVHEGRVVQIETSVKVRFDKAK